MKSMVDVAGLARRAVACPGWRWMPGMAAAAPRDGGMNLGRVLRVVTEDSGEGATIVLVPHAVAEQALTAAERRVLPDLTDPATLGCLQALVREVYAPRWAHLAPRWSGAGYYIVGSTASGVMMGLDDGEYPSEAAALVAALEAAKMGVG